MKKVSVLGLGYIGLPTSIILAEAGFDVLGFDINANKVEKINQGEPGIFEPGVQERLKRVLGVNFRAYITLQESDYYVIAVPTPINQDKTARQWPPTPQRGFKIFTRGCLFAISISSYGLIPASCAMDATWCAKAICTSLQLFSTSFVISAVLASVTQISGFTNAP